MVFPVLSGSGGSAFKAIFPSILYGVATVCLHNTVSGKLQHSAPGCFVLLIKFFTAHWSLEATVPN